MLKELNLIARVVGTALIILIIYISLGFGSIYLLLGIALLVFIQSFMFQYVVFHPTLKQISSKRVRAGILLAILIVSALLFVYSRNQIPDINTLKKDDDYFKSASMWAGISLAFGAVLVAIICTRIAFKRHNAL